VRTIFASYRVHSSSIDLKYLKDLRHLDLQVKMSIDDLRYIDVLHTSLLDFAQTGNVDPVRQRYSS